MPTCNYCSLRRIKERYGADLVTTTPSLNGIKFRLINEAVDNAGLDVCVKTGPLGSLELIAWFALLTDHCVC